MNYSERHGIPYVVTWDLTNQFTMTFGYQSELAEIVGFLEEKEMPIDISKISPNGNMLL